MLLKERFESEELLALRHLNTRMDLSQKEKFYYQNLEKGFEGEVRFDTKAAEIEEERLILNDLFFEANNSYIQIDSLIISQEAIYLMEVKNYQGDFYMDSGKLYSVSSGNEYKNPVDSLKRSVTLFRQLLKRIDQDFLIEPFVIFINPEFTLYQAPRDLPIILPTQVNRFTRDLNNKPSKLNERHRKLAQELLRFHQNENPFGRLPEYSFDEVRKGVCCLGCGSFLVRKEQYSFVCEDCGKKEPLQQAILRHVEEFKLLFPDKKLNTKNIYEWCGRKLDQKSYRRVLKKHYTANGNTSDMHFV